MKQEMGWQWHQLDYMQIICTSLKTNNDASTSSLKFSQAGCSYWRPTNSVKALKAPCHRNRQIIQHVSQHMLRHIHYTFLRIFMPP